MHTDRVHSSPAAITRNQHLTLDLHTQQPRFTVMCRRSRRASAGYGCWTYSGVGALQQHQLLNSGLAAHTMSSPILKLHNTHLQPARHDRPKEWYDVIILLSEQFASSANWAVRAAGPWTLSCAACHGFCKPKWPLTFPQSVSVSSAL